jgi:hypothetical protein
LPPNDSYDDLDNDSKMNGFGIDVDDDHKMILQNMELFMEDTIDQGVDGMVQVEAPMQMVTLIL